MARNQAQSEAAGLVVDIDAAVIAKKVSNVMAKHLEGRVNAMHEKIMVSAISFLRISKTH